MATEYSALYKPGQEVTLTTSGAVSAGDALVVSGDLTVAASSGVSAAFAGVAKYDAASGAKVGVLSGGVHILNSTGTINAGDLITTAANGDVAAYSGTTYSTIIGVALNAAASNKVTARLFR